MIHALTRCVSPTCLLRIAVAFLWVSGPMQAAADKTWWRVYDEVQFLEDEYHDGDSFSLAVKSGSRSYNWKIRIYGSDTPETEADTRSPLRLKEQAETFGLSSEKDVIAWGKKAKKATESWFSRARKIRLFVRAAGKEDGNNKRYLGIVEITPKDGPPFLLHERLLEEGLASPTSYRAPWPEKDLPRYGEAKLKDRFRRDLELKAGKARRAGTGIWHRK